MESLGGNVNARRTILISLYILIGVSALLYSFWNVLRGGK